jgi:excisionase family DNA binding protein
MPEASVHCGGVPSPETLYRLAREGHLPVRRIGRRLVISERLLDQWIDSIGDVRDAKYPGTGIKSANLSRSRQFDPELETLDLP